MNIVSHHLKTTARRVLPWSLLLLSLGCEVSEVPSASPARVMRRAVTEDDAGPLSFVHGYEAGLEQATSEGRPMLVFFTAQWCRYCHQMAEEAFTDGQVVLLSDRFVCIVVDADQEPDVCQRFGVQAFPTVQFLSPQGVPLNRLIGKKAGTQLAFEMRAALQAVAQRAKTQQQLLR